MAAPFFDNISGTVTSAPGTGAFTPTAASAGAEAWSTVPANVFVNYRADEGSTWERGLGLWNGTTLTRILEQSSTGSLVSFGTGVVVIADVAANHVQPHIGGGKWCMWNAVSGGTAGSVFAIAAPVVVGTAAAGTIASTNYLTRQHRVQYTSATTANALNGLNWTTSGVYRSTTAFMSGWEIVVRMGVSAIPTGDRFICGLSAAGTMTTVEPSTLLNMAAFINDSGDTNIQFATNDGTSTATKVDTGFPFVANAYYEFTIWQNPGEAKIYWAIIRLDNGTGATGSVTSDLPVNDTLMLLAVQTGLSATTGTATVAHISSVYLRTSF